ncbi:hypothetical protein BPOR_1260g00020 [Botrytis porri]|uniref:Uncharacterized protein n=1 Tax=Botrytis porri TaxID=87229 RepID=A0A4Z1KIC8_9HELO|nr:hypothetical protein BPOR_1260g00020 [Botrytis porri]
MDGRNSNEQVGNLESGGHCIDLVGTGKTETCHFANIGMNDTTSNFFWRRVDLNMGAIEIFADPNLAGIAQRYGLGIDSLASSLRWRTLSDRQYASLYNTWDGTGDAYNNIKGWGNIKEIANLSDVKLNDEIAVPKKEIIVPFNISASNADSQTNLTDESSGINKSDIDQLLEVTLDNSTSQTITVESSDQHVVGVDTSFSQTMSAGVEGVAPSSTPWAVQLSYSYINTATKSNSVTKTIILNVKQSVNRPARSYYRATLLVLLGQLRAAEYETTAER